MTVFERFVTEGAIMDGGEMVQVIASTVQQIREEGYAASQ